MPPTTPTVRPNPESPARALARLRSALAPVDRPSDEAILAYVEGTASAAEGTAVQRAIAWDADLAASVADLAELRIALEAVPEPRVAERSGRGSWAAAAVALLSIGALGALVLSGSPEPRGERTASRTVSRTVSVLGSETPTDATASLDAQREIFRDGFESGATVSWGEAAPAL